MEPKGAPAAIISAVLDDDDLLSEILVRLAFPTSLVSAALVCKRWLRLASAPAFLRRFGDLHPPVLLGFYAVTMDLMTADTQPPRFVPVPQPPELADVVRRGSFDLDSLDRRDWNWVDLDCWNGRVFITSFPLSTEGLEKCMVRWPLYAATGTTVLPTLLNTSTSIHGGFTYYCEILPNRSCGEGLSSCFYLAISTTKEQQSVLDVYELQDDNWAIYSSTVTETAEICPIFRSFTTLDDKICNLVRVDGVYKLFWLDLGSSCLSLVNLPEDPVKLRYIQISFANDSGVHYVHTKGSHLRIWLYMVNKNGGLGDWSLVHTISLREIWADHGIPTSMFNGVGRSAVWVCAAEVNFGFLILVLNNVIYLLDIKRKVVKKVYELTQEDRNNRFLYGVPFMMVWPPKFPVMEEECVAKQ